MNFPNYDISKIWFLWNMTTPSYDFTKIPSYLYRANGIAVAALIKFLVIFVGK